jgi:hypothetical protein
MHQMNNNFKKILLICLQVGFGYLAATTAYLFSLRFDGVPWGDESRDGLFMLTYPMVILPSTLFFAIVKYKAGKTSGCEKANYFFYTLVMLGVFLLSIFDAYSQIFLLVGILANVIICLLVLVEIFRFIRTY